MSLRNKFTVYDEYETPLYTVEGKVISARRKHSIYNIAGEEVANISMKILSLMPTFFIECPIGTPYEMRGKFAFARKKYEIKKLGWELNGNFLQHDYTITKAGIEIASIHQKWISWGDTYEITVVNDADTVMVLAAILCIDIADENAAVTTGSNT